jgi:hypothetical protein
VKILLPQSTAKDSLRKLHELNNRLQRLLTNSANSGYPAQGRVPKTSTVLPPNVLRRISAQANEIYNAIYEGYRCECRDGHETNLGLHSPEDHDLVQPFEIVFPVDEDTAKQITQEDKESISSPADSRVESFECETKRCHPFQLLRISTETNKAAILLKGVGHIEGAWRRTSHH